MVSDWLRFQKKRYIKEIFFEALKAHWLIIRLVRREEEISIHVETNRTNNRSRSLSLMNSDQQDNVS